MSEHLKYKYDLTVWLEVHLKLNSPNKLFCRCANVQEFEELEANIHICPVCTWQPWALPVLNREPLEKAILLGTALGCQIQEYSQFDRKSYMYPDLPMAYQITQQYMPTCVEGSMKFFVDKEYTQACMIRIDNAHIETDTGKSTRIWDKILLDYNRAWTPLIEIVTYPDFTSIDQVLAFLKELQRVAKSVDVSEAAMEHGQMRADVNISIKPVWSTTLGKRVELKNMNSLSAIRAWIEYEVERQSWLLDAWSPIDQETRGRDDAKKESYIMRSKEDAMDYRYMPEPDLPTLHCSKEFIQSIDTSACDQLPYTLISTRKEQYGFNKEYINGLLTSPDVTRYFLTILSILNGSTDADRAKEIAKRIVWPTAQRLWDIKSIADLPFEQSDYSAFIELILDWAISSSQAKIVYQDMLEQWISPQSSIDTHWFKPIDLATIQLRVDEVFTQKPDILEEMQSGSRKQQWFVIGQIMKRSQWSADPAMITQAINNAINKSNNG